MNQNKKVLELLKKYGATGIDQKDAIREIGCYRLASRINDLRNHGYIVDTDKPNSFGILAKYTLIDDAGGLPL